MANAGRPRRNRSHKPISHGHMHQAPPPQVMPHHPRSSMKEEPPVQLHDEADLISFRSDALNRFVTNQEYLENVTSKPIHTSKITPPPVFPLEQPIRVKRNRIDKPDKEQIAFAAKNLKPEELYFGDVDLMRAKEELVAKEVEDLKQTKVDPFDKDSDFHYRQEKIDRLAHLQATLFKSCSIDDLEKEIDVITKEYKLKFGKVYHTGSEFRKYSVPIESISTSIDVAKAPDSYNPRSINSLINIGNNHNGHNDHVLLTNGIGGTDNGAHLHNGTPGLHSMPSHLGGVDTAHFASLTNGNTFGQGGVSFMSHLSNNNPNNHPPPNDAIVSNTTNPDHAGYGQNNDINSQAASNKESPAITAQQLHNTHTPSDATQHVPSDQQTKLNSSVSTDNFNPNDFHISNEDLSLSNNHGPDSNGANNIATSGHVNPHDNDNNKAGSAGGILKPQDQENVGFTLNQHPLPNQDLGGGHDHHDSAGPNNGGMVDDDINQLLSTGGDPNVMDAHGSDIVNDDMGALINFQDDDDDGGIMSSHAFDTDFLSQIDHSME